MLILRMLSGLLAGVYRLVARKRRKTADGGRLDATVRNAMKQDRRVARQDPDPAKAAALAGREFRDDILRRTRPSVRGPAIEAGARYWECACDSGHLARWQTRTDVLYQNCPDCGELLIASRSSVTCAGIGEDAEELKRVEGAAKFHARAARKAIVDWDGKGTLEHMRHFRRYSSILKDLDRTFDWAFVAALRESKSRLCRGCGSSCAARDMVKKDAVRREPGPFCTACAPPRKPNRSDRTWTTKEGRRFHVREMCDRQLVDVARMVRQWLRSGKRVNDDRIRMCGHVLVECSRRKLDVRGTWKSSVVDCNVELNPNDLLRIARITPGAVSVREHLLQVADANGHHTDERAPRSKAIGPKLPIGTLGGVRAFACPPPPAYAPAIGELGDDHGPFHDDGG